MPNDKNYVLLAYLVPRTIPIVLARLFRSPEPRCLAVFFDRRAKRVNILEVPVK